MDTKNKMKTYSFKPYEFSTVEPESKEKPLARSGHQLLCDSKGNIYLMGGYNSHLDSFPHCSRVKKIQGHFVFTELWKFNIARNTWQFEREISSKYPKSASASTTAIMKNDNEIIFYGGSSYPFGTCSILNPGKIDLVNKKVVEYELCPENYTPVGKYGVGVVIVKDKYLYAIGGTTGHNYEINVDKFNLKTGKWVSVFDYDKNTGNINNPHPRYKHEVIYDGDDYIYVIGGCTATKIFGFISIPVFNLKTNEWEWRNTHPDERNAQLQYPKGRKFNAFSTFKNERNETLVYVFAGCLHSEIMLNDLWELNMTTLKWRYVPCINSIDKVKFHAATVTKGGKMYIFGGTCSNENKEYRVNAFFSIWLQVPKLSEMCWEAVQFYISAGYGRDLFHPAKKMLLKSLGVPEEFLLRI